MADEETRQKILSLATDFPRLWNDPALEPRERKRMLRLLLEDATLVKTDVITVHVRLRGGATRTPVLPRPVPIVHIRKVKPAVVAEIDRLLKDHCDCEIAELLNRQGLRTWQDRPFTLKKVAWTRYEAGQAVAAEVSPRIGASHGSGRRHSAAAGPRWHGPVSTPSSRGGYSIFDDGTQSSSSVVVSSCSGPNWLFTKIPTTGLCLGCPAFFTAW